MLYQGYNVCLEGRLLHIKVLGETLYDLTDALKQSDVPNGVDSDIDLISRLLHT